MKDLERGVREAPGSACVSRAGRLAETLSGIEPKLSQRLLRRDAATNTRDACATHEEMNTLPKKIAVLMGGPGSERDVSFATGRGVAKALRSLGAADPMTSERMSDTI